MNVSFATLLSFAAGKKGAEAIRYLHPHVDAGTAYFLDSLIAGHRQAVRLGIMHDVFEAVELMVGCKTLDNPRVEFLRMVKDHVEAKSKGDGVDSKWLSTLAHRFAELESVTPTLGWMKYEYAMATLLASRKDHHHRRVLEVFDTALVALRALPEAEGHDACSRLTEMKSLALLRVGDPSGALAAWRTAADRAILVHRFALTAHDQDAALDAARRILHFRTGFHEHPQFRQFDQEMCGVPAGLKAELVAAHPSLEDPPC